MAPLEPYTMELMRRMVEECNMSFSAAATATILVWGMLFEDPIPEDFIISERSFANAFLKMGLLDSRAAALKNKEADAPWAFAADGGNKGVAVNIIAASVWDAELGKPVTQPIACAHLNADQSSHNCAETVNRTLAEAGLQPARCVQGMSDGASAAQKEAVLVLEKQHKLHCDQVAAAAAAAQEGACAAAAAAAAAAADAEAQAAPASEAQAAPAAAAAPKKRSAQETCAIHAKALEERAFLEKAFPLMEDGLRLLWELIKGDGGKVEEYRIIWEEQLDEYPAQNGALYQLALAQVCPHP